MMKTCNNLERVTECTVVPPGRTGCGDVYRPISVSPVNNDELTAGKQPVNTCLPSVARLSHPSNYYNSAKRGIYPRYSQCDWDASYAANLGLSHAERHLAERVRAESTRIVNKSEYQARMRQCASTKRLGQRAHDISFWKEELIMEISKMEQETLDLLEQKRISEVALAELKCNLKISEECLLQREKRTGIDQVRDELERCISKEILLERKAKKMFEQMIEKAEIQLKLNRYIQHACDLDVRDKNHSQNIDERMEQLNNCSLGVGHHPGIEYIDDTISTVKTWAKFTQENLRRSQLERECSERQRGSMDAQLRALTNALWAQFNSVNASFTARITETKNAKSNLQDHLLRVNQEILDMERNIDWIRQAIDEKDKFLQVAQTRLEGRVKRMNVEATHDPAMTGLQREVEELRRALDLLRHKLHDAQMSLCRLLKTRNALQMDIAIKENTIQIDERCCGGMRRGMAMDPCAGVTFNMPTEAYRHHGTTNC